MNSDHYAAFLLHHAPKKPSAGFVIFQSVCHGTIVCRGRSSCMPQEFGEGISRTMGDLSSSPAACKLLIYFFYFEIFSTWNEKCWKSLHWPVLQQGCGPCLRGAETQNQPCTFTTSALRHSLQQSKPVVWIEQKSFSPQGSDYINPHSPGQCFLKNVLGGQSFWPLQS